MTFLRLCAVAGFLALLGGASASAQALLEQLSSHLNIEGLETTYDPESGLATAKGEVRISYGDVEISCGNASYNATTGEVIARDGVVVWKAGTTYRGDLILYNANTNELSGDAVRSSMPLEVGTIFYKADKFETDTKLIERIEGENAVFTTHDLANPNFRLRARHLTIYPDDRVVMRDVTVFAGDTPIFYLPYISQPLRDEVGYRFTPGYTTSWGAFLLNQYGVIHGDHTIAKYRLDLRSRRGVGVGADFVSIRHQSNQNNFGTLKLYYLHDINSDTNRTSGQTRVPVDENRYRINFQHRIYLPGPERSTWYLDFDINKVSDVHFYEDFFFNDFRETPEPENQVSLVHTDPAYIATLMARIQLNDFYRVGEKLPEASIDFTRRPLWESGIYHQGTISAGILREASSDADPLAFAVQRRPLMTAGTDFLGGGVLSAVDAQAFRDLLGLPAGSVVGIPEVTRGLSILNNTVDLPAFLRFHTYQEFLYPKTLFGWLNVVPRIGAGITHYSNIEGSLQGLPRNDAPSSDTKPLFHAGLDVSFKITRTWEDYQLPALGLDGLRHVIQPYLNYSYLDADQPEGFPSIDRLSPTTRPRSLDVPLFTAIDDLSSWNVTRLGVRNLLQTRRDYSSYGNGIFGSVNTEDTQTYSWAGLNTYIDVFTEDPEFNRDLSNLYNEVFWRPVPWMSFWLDSQLPLNNSNGGFTESNYGVTVMPVENVSLSLGHQFISGHPYFQDSSLIFSRVYARLSENWGVSMNHIYEMDDATMEFQSYSLTRDFSSWIASVGGMVRNSRSGVADYGILFSLTLKDFPQVNIPLDIDPNPSGRGGSR